MGGCSAINCSNHSRHGYRMFRFPKERERRKKWIINTRRTEWEPGPSAQLCIVHFEDSQFEAHCLEKKLKHNAIPTLFNVPNKPHLLMIKRQEGCLKPKSLLYEKQEKVHFEENQFELHRQDGWRKLKPNAIPTIFNEISDSNKEQKQLNRKRKLQDSDEISNCKTKSNLRQKRQSSLAQRKRSPRQSYVKSEPQLSNSDTSEKSPVSNRQRKSKRPRKLSIAEIDDSSEDSNDFKPSHDEAAEEKILFLKQENETMRKELLEFEKHNKAMSKVILEFEKHNKAMSLRLQELDKNNKILTKRLQELEKQNEDLKAKLNVCFSEEQLSRMDKMSKLGKIERYIPAIK